MIGVYDSGVGGLTVLSYLRERMPNADLLYLGDTVNLPYGSKPPALLFEYAKGAFSFFSKHALSMLLVACGTISTVVLENSLPKQEFPILGVAKPAAERLRSLGCKRIAILATEASIASGVYERLLFGLDAELLALPCPSFVPLAEGGRTSGKDPTTAVAVERELAPLRTFHPDAILLGCTHFPLFSETIRALYPFATIVDCGRAAVDTVDTRLHGKGSGKAIFFVTGSPDAFRRSAEQIFIDTAHLEVHQINL